MIKWKKRKEEKEKKRKEEKTKKKEVKKKMKKEKRRVDYSKGLLLVKERMCE